MTEIIFILFRLFKKQHRRTLRIRDRNQRNHHQKQAQQKYEHQHHLKLSHLRHFLMMIMNRFEYDFQHTKARKTYFEFFYFNFRLQDQDELQSKLKNHQLYQLQNSYLRSSMPIRARYHRQFRRKIRRLNLNYRNNEINKKRHQKWTSRMVKNGKFQYNQHIHPTVIKNSQLNMKLEI